MIKFAAICPHPPLLIPGIGKPNDLKLVDKTIKAMEALSHEISKENINTVIIISPHGIIYPDRINISYGGEFQGDFHNFGENSIKFDYLSDDVLAQKIISECDEEGILINRYTENDVLDHGVMVPMFYLREGLRENVKILPINYSMLSSESHFSFGEIIGSICNSDEYKNTNIAIVASGDMSHRLFNDTSADFNEAGKKFDKKIAHDLKNNSVSEILEYDPNYLEIVGECGYRSVVILLGALSKMNYKPNILSYEGPFGVGYLVANFKIK